MNNQHHNFPAASTGRVAAMALAAALLVASLPAAAQYVWIDGTGHKVYSDRSPPSAVPLKNILKAPNLAQYRKDAADAEAAAAAAAAAPPPKPAPTLAERNAEYNKRKAEELEKAQKDAEESKRKDENDRICASLRENQKLIDSGTRLGTVTQSGERGYMSDAERATKRASNEQALANCH